MDLLKMLVNNGLNWGANSFRILAEISKKFWSYIKNMKKDNT
jgi:hypothetical protein